LKNQLLTLFLAISDDPTEATDSAYATYLTSLNDTINTYATGVVGFSTSGRCSSTEVLDTSGNWITGYCNV
jgi:hypothetical protein